MVCREGRHRPNMDPEDIPEQWRCLDCRRSLSWRGPAWNHWDIIQTSCEDLYQLADRIFALLPLMDNPMITVPGGGVPNVAAAVPLNMLVQAHANAPDLWGDTPIYWKLKQGDQDDRSS